MKSSKIFTKSRYSVPISDMVPMILLLLFLGGCQPSAPQPVSDPAHISHQTVLPAYPDTMVVCGIRLPLEDPEVRDRFEREFYNTLHNENVSQQTIAAANTVFPIILPIIREAGLPEDLKYLAIAESNLRTAVSVAGATGVWQLMELVARSENLKINYWVDERNHLEKSTRVAMTFLKHLHKKYGDWNLAFAAYNVGETNINDNLKFQHVRRFFDLYLNEETSRYIFRIYAAKAVFEDPTKYGLPAYEFKTDSYRYVTINGPVENLTKLALEQGTSYRQLRILNPWIRRRGLPEGTWTLAFPSSSVPGSIDLAGYEYTKNPPVGTTPSGVVTHKVTDGDTLLSIALAYDVEVNEIRRWNNLKSDMIMVGQQLKIYLK